MIRTIFLALGAILAAIFTLLPSSHVFARPSEYQLTNDVKQLNKRFINQTILDACKSLQPSKNVHYILSPQYSSTLLRYIASTTQTPVCLFLPDQPQQIADAINVIGAKRIPFAVSSGRHASNKGFSTTTGIQIDMKGFQGIVLDSSKQFVDVGSGNIWDNVYQVLEGTGVNIVGGRVTGVGVGGFITGGGGYSWKTNQYGLTVDTLIKADMVLPNGTLVTASANENPDLFWAIKGGGNQFGIIYNFRLKTNPQTAQVYGGLRTYTQDQIPAIIQAVSEFSDKNTDAKAQTIPTFNTLAGIPGISLLGFYDGPDPGTSLDYFNAPATTAKAFTNGWKAQSFSDLVRSAPANATAYQRGLFHSVQLKHYSLPMLQQIANQSAFWGSRPFRSGTFISYDVEPFLADWANGINTDAAWPHGNSPIPLNIYYAWSNPLDDQFYREAALESARVLNDLANSEGQQVDQFGLYPNYAIDGSTAEQVFRQNAPRLAQLKKQFDPQNVMGLTTYFSFT
ncbi:FAD-binding domain-containing protein [Meira miltonrushii]|uniref:FAD-binding domain-containing protein n=1 Tax=Meira miltonrushii TaxID=1280837 RepID=A0A316V6U3_9BASI|nr:FAD-binding domain-containing protein [Meira miltonrushii]PWN33142.1 FAD-binding domain-containing protein [Meira miltonrushii]